jgi:hypothetical protein
MPHCLSRRWRRVKAADNAAQGGYETWLGTNRLEVEASNKILAKLLALVGGLK